VEGIEAQWAQTKVEQRIDDPAHL